MVFSSIIPTGHQIPPAFGESGALSDLYHLNVSEGMQLMMFASLPALTACLICLAITRSH